MNALCSFKLCTLSNEELIKLVDEKTDQMFQNQKVPVRHIPARPNSDYDLLVGELINRFGGIVDKEESTTDPLSIGKSRDIQILERKVSILEKSLDVCTELAKRRMEHYSVDMKAYRKIISEATEYKKALRSIPKWIRRWFTTME